MWHKSCRDIFSNTKLERAKKRKISEVEKDEKGEGDINSGEASSNPIKSRRSSTQSCLSQSHCFFCEQLDSPINLHAASTLEVDQKVRDCAILLQDTKLIAKLSVGDLIATDAKYHAKCLVGLYNRARKLKLLATKPINVNSTIEPEELAFAELLAYIDEYLECEEFAVLKLSDLAKVYHLKAQGFGIEPGKINTTRLKERILVAFPDLTAHNEGREVLLVLKQDIAGIVRKAERKDSEAWHLAKTANIIRKDMLQVKNSFNGTFAADCQKYSIPASTAEPADSQACLTVAQLILFNSISRARDRPGSTGSTHHIRSRECPLPIYTALKIHGSTRDKGLIDTFYKLGMCISYDRLLSITTEITNSVIERYESEGAVCPANLREGLFITAAVDNIDHNPSSTSAHDSFHGTAILLVQHPTTEEQGYRRPIDTFDPTTCSSSKKIVQLPSWYSEVQPLAQPPAELFAPEIAVHLTSAIQESDYENDWLRNTKKLLSKEELDKDDSVSWAAYRATQSTMPCYEPAIISLLPMFLENAHSLAMIAHSMKVIKSAVEHVNPTQIPVIALDQPLFALAKQIQWTLGHEYNEDKFVFMFGGLHIEMSAFKVLGKWLTGSGWTQALCNAGVATQGVADSFIAVKHLTRTRRAHQVTAASLYILMIKEYNAFTANITRNEVAKPMEEWKEEMSKKSPQFLYWSRVLDLQLCCLYLVRSFREANFASYIKAIKQLLPWIFALDHLNYARWLSVHYRDMSELAIKHPDVHQQFTNGSFVVHKTKKVFSSIALDHAHEQVNAVVKGEGGAVGLTESPAALRRWMVAGPEVARMVEEFEGNIFTAEDQRHHEQKPGVQSAFAKDVGNLVAAFEEFGSPFSEEGEELMAIHTKDVMNAAVVKTVRDVKKIGEQQFETFVKERFINRKKPITNPLKKNNLPTFSTQSKKVILKDKAKVKELKEDCASFSRIYIACQSRDGNLEEFFAFENQPWPPSLAQFGKIRAGQKADLVKCLRNAAVQTVEKPTIDAVILDGAVIVQMLPPKTALTFEEYFNTVFAPYILKQLEMASRVDVVWDDYRQNSLKSSTREKRGSGQRQKVLSSTLIPTDWKGFLRVDDNKDELFKLLASKVVSLAIPYGKEIYTTHGQNVLTSSNRMDLDNLAPCTHEEADTRLMLHAMDACVCGNHRIKIRSSDTDVVVLVISVAHTIKANELWIAYGSGKTLSYLPVHSIAEALGQEKSSALPMFHALTGCDTVSFFYGRGKKTAWDV